MPCKGVLSRKRTTGRDRLSAKKATASGLAGRYATALFELAREHGALDKVESDLNTVEAALQGSPELRRTLRSPIVSREEHERTLGAFADQTGLGDLVRNFMGLLAQKRRLAALEGMLGQFRQLVAAHRGEETAEVVSATPLGASDLDRLRESVARHAGRAVNLTTRVDPSLLGGLVVRIGSRMIDASLKTRLQQLELSMRGIR